MDDKDSTYSLPGLEVISDPSYVEYRYYPDRSEKLRYLHRHAWLDSAVICLVAYLCSQNTYSRWRLSAVIGFLSLYVYWRCSRVIYESVIAIPPHGLQLETHKGPFREPLFVSRRFIPSVFIQDIIINEALHRWNVRYYIAVIVEVPGENIELALAFENTLPYFPVLQQVYRGVIKVLYSE